MLIKSKLEIDLQQPGFKKVAYAVQNDSNTRALEISLFLNEVAWEIPSGTTAAISFRKMDLTSGLYDTLPDGSTKAVTFSGNTLTAILAPQVLTCAGKVDVSIALYDSDLDRLGVFPVLLYVSADPSAGKSLSNNYYYLSTLAAVNEAIGNLNDLKTADKSSLVAAINSLSQGNVTEEQIQAAVDSYLDKNPVEATPLDPTLTKEGYAADAKAVGEALSKVPSSEVDLSGYATQKWVQQGYQPKGEYLTKAPVSSVNGKTGAVSLSASDVGALPNTYTPPDQTAAQVGADPAGTAAAAVSTHNTSTDSHGDLRLELKAISDRLTAFFDSDNTTLDELSEIVAYITSNKALIDSITTSKVSVTDIINNLTSNVANKPLSAAQGVALKGLIDAVSTSLANYQPKGDYALRSELPTVPTNVSAFTNDAGYLTKHQDISGKIDKNGLTLGIHTDGLIYVFVDGVPVGNGIEMGVSGDVFGYVDENNNIVVQGDLPDGTYSVKYEMADGSTVNIGNLVLDTNVYYTITNTLTQCTTNNSATQAVQGGSYSATITAKSGYELSSVKVTMGGTDISSTAVSGGKITIANVTGNIVITAVATEVATTPKGNLADPTSADWQEGYRLSVSSGSTQPLDGHTTTNYISCKAGDTLRVKGLGIHSTATSGGSSADPKIVWYKTDKVKITGAFGTSAPNSSQCYGAQVSVDGDISTYTVAILNDGVQYANSACEWIRIDGFLMDGYTKNDVIITINEEIV